MLNTKDVTATIAVKDLIEGKEFYHNKLGFEVTGTDGENYCSLKSGNTSFLIYQSQFAGNYNATVATWNVGDDIETIVKLLKEKDITFERYDFPHMKRSGDIHIMGTMRNAWFKDPNGNILCLVNG